MRTHSERLRTKNEATGMRIVSQFVQEFWECGWQPFDHRNDKGIDGLILMHKKNEDLGIKINVQVKCGAGYISSETSDEIRISIDDSEGLIEHLEYWRNQIEPVVLVFVNPSKPERDENGKILKDDKGKTVWKESRLKASAWWADVKDVNIQPPNSKTLISIKKINVFGEHSKGDFIKLIKPLLNGKNLQILTANKESTDLLSSSNLRQEAYDFYKNWKKEETYCKALGQNIIVSRTGWRHITLSRRGKERRNASLQLLGIAKQIIQEAENFFLLSQTEEYNQTIQKIGLRTKIKTKSHGTKIIQVIILRRMWKISRKSKWWFYSVHNRN